MKNVLTASILSLAVATFAAAQHTPSDCESNRGKVRTGAVGGVAFDPSNPTGTVISLEDFVAKRYGDGNDAPNKRPSVVAPERRVAGEGIVYVIENVEAGGFSHCGSAGLTFEKVGDFGGYDFGTFAGYFPHKSCIPAELEAAVGEAYRRFSQELSIWPPWKDDECVFGGEKTVPLRVTGISFWDDTDGLVTPRLTLSPILAIAPMDDDDDSGGGSGTPPPPPPPFRIALSPEFDAKPLTVSNSAALTIPFSVVTTTPTVTDLQLSVETDAPAHETFTASVTPSLIPAPGSGQAEVTITTGPRTFPRMYRVLLVAEADNRRFERVLLVALECDPPTILGINQPRIVSAAGKSTIQMIPNGSAPISYQWYGGYRGMTGSPVEGATAADLTPPAPGMYWVRITNACGSADSNPVIVP